jgi:hypothetical protein
LFNLHAFGAFNLHAFGAFMDALRLTHCAAAVVPQVAMSPTVLWSTMFRRSAKISMVMEGVAFLQFKYLDFFRTGPSQIAMIPSTSFSITLFLKPKDSIVWIWKIQYF